MTVATVGERPSPAHSWFNRHVVSPEYFDTMGIRLVAGRNFTGAEDPKAKRRKVVVNQAFVRRSFRTWIRLVSDSVQVDRNESWIGMFEIIGW